MLGRDYIEKSKKSQLSSSNVYEAYISEDLII